jgi:nicotinate phosphoribosyltransferase
VGPSLALLTDLYQLTMAYGYWKSRVREHEAVFHLYFRENPFGGGYAIACGLERAVEWLRTLHFTDDDLAYLATLRGTGDEPLFEERFLDQLADFRFRCDVDAVPEGTVVFAGEPLVRVRGKLIQAQLVETALLTLINFPTLVATKASRVCRAAGGDDVLEFGMRRAQGLDGALTASRAAYVGGCAATSNVLAGKRFGIPVRGTHAHSWVLVFGDEQEAFEAFSHVMHHNCVLLVDTFDTLEGVRRAIEVGHAMEEQGHHLDGIRLDSGDLADLATRARRMLDDAGLESVRIVGSNDLDEYSIEELRKVGAPITVWGVGTRLATAWEQPALGGVYKLTAAREPDGEWEYRAKATDDASKASPPGILQVRRTDEWSRYAGDVIYDENLGLPRNAAPGHDLLAPVLRAGRLEYEFPPLEAVRDRTLGELERFDPEVLALRGASQYPVKFERRLSRLRKKLQEKGR